MKFKPGQEVVCTSRVDWGYEVSFLGFKSRRAFIGPKKDEIVTVEGYTSNLNDCVMLKEYNFSIHGARVCYDEGFFEPVVPQEEIDRLMEEISVKNEYMKMAQIFSSI